MRAQTDEGFASRVWAHQGPKARLAEWAKDDAQMFRAELSEPCARSPSTRWVTFSRRATQRTQSASNNHACRQAGSGHLDAGVRIS